LAKKTYSLIVRIFNWRLGSVFNNLLFLLCIVPLVFFLFSLPSDRHHL